MEAPQKIISTAKDLFWKYGIRKVTVEEICKEAGLSKMTFYRHFKSKKEVAQHILKTQASYNFEAYQKVMKNEKVFKLKIEEIIELKHVATTGLSEEFLKDLLKDEELMAQMKKSQQDFQIEFLKDLKMAQEKSWIRKDLKPEFIIYMLDNINHKIEEKEFLDLFEDKQEAIMELTKFFFYGISPSN